VQVAQILDVRVKVLQRMNNLSDVRNHLALRAVGILLPSRQRPSTHPSHEARLQSLEVCLPLPHVCFMWFLQTAAGCCRLESIPTGTISVPNCAIINNLLFLGVHF
jgi:hypothetical protein